MCMVLSKMKRFAILQYHPLGFPGGSVVKNPPVNAGDLVSIPGSERSPGEGNGNPLQYSCLENPMDREAWQTRVHRVTKELEMTERLNDNNIPRPGPSETDSTVASPLL